MTAKRNNWRGVIALGGILFLCLAVSRASAGDVEDRIRALEEVQRANAAELEKLKGEQIELRKEATAAAAAMPSFTYRPRRGLLIEAGDKSWAIRTWARMHYRALFFPDDDGVAKKGFSQFDIALRRWRWGFNPEWDNGLYELFFEMDGGADRSIQIQHGEFDVHLDKINAYLPSIIIGPRVSGFFNRHDTNWGSSTGGLFDRSMFQDGAGIGAGSQNNAIGLFWNGLRVGPSELLFQAIFSNQGLRNIADQERPNSDKRALHIGFNIEPFKRIKNKWIQGIDFGVGYQLDQLGNLKNDEGGGDGTRGFFRVRTTERQRLALIEVNRDLGGQRHYITPGFGWKIGPYWLRTAGGFNFGHFNSNQAGQEGGLVRGTMFRIAHELFVWSPKGVLTGSTSTPGSVMLFVGYERDDYKAPSGTGNGGTFGSLRDCSSTVPGGECQGAYAYNSNWGLWYIIRPGLRVGAEYGFYHVNKIGRGGGSITELSSTSCTTAGNKCGRERDFNTLELGITMDF